MATIVRTENVTKQYEAHQSPVLKGINLAIEENEFVAIMGPSGSGKSTLIHLMGGLDRASNGRVYLRDLCLNDLPDKALSRLRRQTIGFVFQLYNLIPVLTARENIARPLIFDGVKRAEALNRATAMLAATGFKADADQRPGELSGGEQQRVAIARALIAAPSLILADEPTGALDTRSGDEIVALLRYTVDTLQNTVVLVTHDPRVAANAHRIIYLRDGEIVDDNRMSPSAFGTKEARGHLQPPVRL